MPVGPVYGGDTPGTPFTVVPLRNESALPMTALMQLFAPFLTFSLDASRCPARHGTGGASTEAACVQHHVRGARHRATDTRAPCSNQVMFEQLITATHRGETILIRSLSPDDKRLIVAGLERMSEQSRYRRFLAPKESFTAAELAYLTEVDHRDHEALIALDPEAARRWASPATSGCGVSPKSRNRRWP